MVTEVMDFQRAELVLTAEPETTLTIDDLRRFIRNGGKVVHVSEDQTVARVRVPTYITAERETEESILEYIKKVEDQRKEYYFRLGDHWYYQERL